MIVVAPTSYKGTHSAADAARAMAHAARQVTDLEVRELPVSDGGPGLIDSLYHAFGGVLHPADVTGPHGQMVRGRILVQNDSAIIESADACGLHLVPPSQRNPLTATTFGVGELIMAAAQYAPNVIAGLGGSATIDGGAGAALALLMQRRPEITALADVNNPLLGSNGAARVFGPQKGASPADVEILEARLQEFADRIRREMGIDVATIPGGGAAGGLGAGLHAFAGARLVSGSIWVIERLGIAALLDRASALVTGEGRYDEQSAMGKITGTLVRMAEQRNVPVLIVAGDGSGELTLDDLGSAVRAGLRRLLAP
jgi:glycerate 2-kinase